jgi:translation initiation factor IF-2
MAAVTGKVRVYDLAKELKLENRKIIDDARRFGVIVSVPSNTLDDNIADKIRELYFPKKEQAVTQRSARLIKHAVPLAAAPAAAAPAPATVTQAAPAAAAVAPAAQVTQPVEQAAAPAPAPVAPAPATPAAPATALRPLTTFAPAPAPAPKPAPALVVAEAPAPIAPMAEPAPTTMAPLEEEKTTQVTQLEAPAPAETVAAPIVPAAPEVPPKVAPAVVAAAPAPAQAKTPAGPPGRTNVIRLTPAKPFVPPPPVAPARPGRDARGGRDQQAGRGGRDQQAGRPQPQAEARAGERQRHILESGKPQLHTYVPPPDARHKGRNAGRAKQETKPEPGDKQPFRRGPQQVAAPQQRQIPTELKSLTVVEGITVREYAEKIDAKPRDIVGELMKRGVLATINQTINPELAKEIGKFYGYDITFGEFEDLIVESEFEITPEAMDDTDLRAPIVTVMGHVDHGKTSLLDAIRSARVAEGEAGGITQHIGAYSVEVANPDNPSDLRRIVFLDTPGHEAFTNMRARGAKVTDLVVLVVAADDGVMPQTIEAIAHSKDAGVPIIVAINKIDKGDANPDRVRKELADRGLLWDNWGGDTTMVELSAKMKQNISGLLEMILLQSDLMDLKANPKRMATGTVLEAKLDRGRGSVATVLVQNGSLGIGNPFIVGNYFGRVRALVNDRGQRVEAVGPAMPVEVLGLEGVPSAGDQFQVVSDVAKAQQISAFRQSKARAAALARTSARGLEQLAKQMQTGEVKELKVILKADVQGSVEVLKDTLLKLSTDKVKVNIIQAGVGAITKSDVGLANASDLTEGTAMVIIGFNVRPETTADELARQEGIDIRLHSIIYKVEEEIRNAMIGMLDATTKEVVIGKAEIRDVIRVPKVGSVAGSMIINGMLKRTAQARLIRDNVVIFESSIGSLRRFKDDVSEVQQGYECGITIDRFNDYKVGDVIEAYVTEKVVPTEL